VRAGRRRAAAGRCPIGIALHRAGYVCKPPRWVLSRKAQAQPGVGKKRLRVEALLAAAASPLPPPAADLVPDATLTDELFPEDLPRLLGLLGRGTCTCKRRSRSPCTRP